ncbi:hypothetical protein SEMRO_148_G068190.1 [Seminavis robusta]|uniref:Uncharacterized protein n=1 Tax=Seminavis robusta TaxID=568900 RepID=A0A9N8DLP5_9STRA|nr:hypothetical protein SEMRO_148_G068190.1 [Seminavis robusta]|eukprot:Sro148_g068190.1 n/a (87) ;mRNA; f:71268-71528
MGFMKSITNKKMSGKSSKSNSSKQDGSSDSWSKGGVSSAEVAMLIGAKTNEQILMEFMGTPVRYTNNKRVSRSGIDQSKKVSSRGA